MSMYQLNFGDDMDYIYFKAVEKSFSVQGEVFYINIVRSKVDEKMYYDLYDRNRNPLLIGEKLTPNQNLLKEISYRYNFGIIALPDNPIAVMQDVTFASLAIGDYKIYWGDIGEIEYLEV